MIKVKKTDSKVLRELKQNQNKLTKLDVGFLMGDYPYKVYKVKREKLRSNVIKIVKRERLRKRLNKPEGWENLR